MPGKDGAGSAPPASVKGWSFFSRRGLGSVTEKKAPPKKASLGNNSSMYYHDGLKRWVERGKEVEAEQEAALANVGPPKLSAGAVPVMPVTTKRAISSRYVLQDGLVVSNTSNTITTTSTTVVPLGFSLTPPSGPPKFFVPTQAPATTGAGDATQGADGSAGTAPEEASEDTVQPPTAAAIQPRQHPFFVPPSFHATGGGFANGSNAYASQATGAVSVPETSIEPAQPVQPPANDAAPLVDCQARPSCEASPMADAFHTGFGGNPECCPEYENGSGWGGQLAENTAGGDPDGGDPAAASYGGMQPQNWDSHMQQWYNPAADQQYQQQQQQQEQLDTSHLTAEQHQYHHHQQQQQQQQHYNQHEQQVDTSQMTVEQYQQYLKDYQRSYGCYQQGQQVLAQMADALQQQQHQGDAMCAAWYESQLSQQQLQAAAEPACTNSATEQHGMSGGGGGGGSGGDAADCLSSTAVEDLAIFAADPFGGSAASKAAHATSSLTTAAGAWSQPGQCSSGGGAAVQGALGNSPFFSDPSLYQAAATNRLQHLGQQHISSQQWNGAHHHQQQQPETVGSTLSRARSLGYSGISTAATAGSVFPPHPTFYVPSARSSTGGASSSTMDVQRRNSLGSVVHREPFQHQGQAPSPRQHAYDPAHQRYSGGGGHSVPASPCVYGMPPSPRTYQNEAHSVPASPRHSQSLYRNFTDHAGHQQHRHHHEQHRPGVAPIPELEADAVPSPMPAPGDGHHGHHGESQAGLLLGSTTHTTVQHVATYATNSGALVQVEATTTRTEEQHVEGGAARQSVPALSRNGSAPTASESDAMAAEAWMRRLPSPAPSPAKPSPYEFPEVSEVMPEAGGAETDGQHGEGMGKHLASTVAQLLPGRLGHAAAGVKTRGRELFGAALGVLAAPPPLAAAAGAAAGLFYGRTGAPPEELDFESVMHPGRSSGKLDGPLPWELPEQLKNSDQFIALCANWQRQNPGVEYSPKLLLPQPEGAAPGAAAEEAMAADDTATEAAEAAAEIAAAAAAACTPQQASGASALRSPSLTPAKRYALTQNWFGLPTNYTPAAVQEPQTQRRRTSHDEGPDTGGIVLSAAPTFFQQWHAEQQLPEADTAVQQQQQQQQLGSTDGELAPQLPLHMCEPAGHAAEEGQAVAVEAFPPEHQTGLAVDDSDAAAGWGSGGDDAREEDAARVLQRASAADDSFNAGAEPLEPETPVAEPPESVQPGARHPGQLAAPATASLLASQDADHASQPSAPPSVTDPTALDNSSWLGTHTTPVERVAALGEAAASSPAEFTARGSEEPSHALQLEAECAALRRELEEVQATAAAAASLHADQLELARRNAAARAAQLQQQFDEALAASQAISEALRAQLHAMAAAAAEASSTALQGTAEQQAALSALKQELSAVQVAAATDREALQEQLRATAAVTSPPRASEAAPAPATAPATANDGEAVAALRSEVAVLTARVAELVAENRYLAEEVESKDAAFNDLSADHEELMLCLGQETTKSQALVEALESHGIDAQPLLDEIEAKWLEQEEAAAAESAVSAKEEDEEAVVAAAGGAAEGGLEEGGDVGGCAEGAGPAAAEGSAAEAASSLVQEATTEVAEDAEPSTTGACAGSQGSAEAQLQEEPLEEGRAAAGAGVLAAAEEAANAGESTSLAVASGSGAPSLTAVDGPGALSEATARVQPLSPARDGMGTPESNGGSEGALAAAWAPADVPWVAPEHSCAEPAGAGWIEHSHGLHTGKGGWAGRTGIRETEADMGQVGQGAGAGTELESAAMDGWGLQDGWGLDDGFVAVGDGQEVL